MRFSNIKCHMNRNTHAHTTHTNMCTNACTFVHQHQCTHMHIHTHTDTHTHTLTHIRTRTYIHSHALAHAHAHTHNASKPTRVVTSSPTSETLLTNMITRMKYSKTLCSVTRWVWTRIERQLTPQEVASMLSIHGAHLQRQIIIIINIMKYNIYSTIITQCFTVQ